MPRRDAVQPPPLVEPRATLVMAAEVITATDRALITPSPEHIRRVD